MNLASAKEISADVAVFSAFYQIWVAFSFKKKKRNRRRKAPKAENMFLLSSFWASTRA